MTFGALNCLHQNSESFKFSSRTHSGTKICFKDVPILTQLSYDERLTFHTRCDYCAVLPQLETLSLTLSRYLYEPADIPHFPSQKNLKQMHLTFGIDRLEAGLPLFFGLFKAAHSLHKLSLELKSSIQAELIHEYGNECLDHKFVKEVEINGFNGHEGEQELVKCIAHSCSSLQRIRLYPKPFRDYNRCFDVEDVKHIAWELTSKLPQKKLEILLELKDPNMEISRIERFPSSLFQ